MKSDMTFAGFDPQGDPFRSTRRQREYMEGLREGLHWSYQRLLEFAGNVTGRTIRDIGELTLEEASLVIDGLKEEL